MGRMIEALFAAVFLTLGILGFIPSLTKNGMLFSLFAINPLTNICHLLFGISAISLFFYPKRYLYKYFQITGVLLGIWGVLGFVNWNGRIFDVFANSPYLTWVHVILSVIALILGFGTNEETLRNQ